MTKNDAIEIYKPGATVKIALYDATKAGVGSPASKILLNDWARPHAGERRDAVMLLLRIVDGVFFAGEFVPVCQQCYSAPMLDDSRIFGAKCPECGTEELYS